MLESHTFSPPFFETKVVTPKGKLHGYGCRKSGRRVEFYHLAQNALLVTGNEARIGFIDPHGVGQKALRFSLAAPDVEEPIVEGTEITAQLLFAVNPSFMIAQQASVDTEHGI